ncbi:MAG: ATP-binding protein [Nocardioides marinisabuli]|uniref:ATP-binding protein n=1 Tax=Nocardioides marinisabuli TaxID=419476 RepID=UPI0032191A16
MPLNRPALLLGAGPRSVQDARRWVVDTCRDIDRPELAECAELGVSELVTNALLHGEGPIRVRVRGTREHPRVEVRDASRERPVLPTPAEPGDEDDLLLTFGRGLSIVARSSDAWGAEIEGDGKVVWFAPAAQFATDDGVQGVITGLDEVPGAAPADPVTVHVPGVPVELYQAFERHFSELRREVRLLALAHESDYPIAKDLSDLFGDIDRELRQAVGTEEIAVAEQRGESTTDVEVVVSRSSADTTQKFVELLDMADQFCREQRLLSLARSEEQRRFQQWYLGEFVRQARGDEPTRWVGADRHSGVC